MNSRISLSFTIISVLASVYFALGVSTKLTLHSDGNLVIEDVTTNIDMSTQLVDILHTISFIPVKDDTKSFFFYVDPSLINNVSYVNVTADQKINENLIIKHIDNGVWEIVFKNSLIRGKSQTIKIRNVFTHVLQSFPSKVTQHEKHYVIFSGPVSLYSPYLILNHTSYVKTGSGDVLSVTAPLYFDIINKSPLIFTFQRVAQESFVNSTAQIHYEHLNNFLTVKFLLRTIEVSHWGSITVTETIELKHSGAKLYGPFHRLLEGNNESTVINNIVTFLPVSATAISIYDDIGNISSSQLREQFDYIEMKFRPRILLFGGWRVKYSIKYNLPSYEYLYNNGDKFILKMRTVDHICNDMVIDTAVVKIILPEGSVIHNLKTPYSVQYLNDSYHLSYLDIIGKPVIKFVKHNLVEDHIQDFVLSYSFSQYKMLFEPFYLILFLELLFTLLIVYTRIDFSVTEKNETDSCSEVALLNNDEKKSTSVTEIKKSFKPRRKRH